MRFYLLYRIVCVYGGCFFFFNDTATTEIYTLSLHDALPISIPRACHSTPRSTRRSVPWNRDRKSTRLNSSHGSISYAVFCLKKKNKTSNNTYLQKNKKTIDEFTMYVSRV